ncbi:hypothetical protein L195_g025761, partial [Trifolium pratense]
GAAWLSSARVVRCLVMSYNERNPRFVLLRHAPKESGMLSVNGLGFIQHFKTKVCSTWSSLKGWSVVVEPSQIALLRVCFGIIAFQAGGYRHGRGNFSVAVGLERWLQKCFCSV